MRKYSIVIALLLATVTVLGLSSAPADAATHHRRHVPVLGSAAFAPMGTGFGTAHPKKIDNGGDPSGVITRIHWKHWGAATARGRGRTSIPMPGGGYYPKLVRAELKAEHLSRCSAHSRKAYTVLLVRVPSKPGGKYGKWFHWSDAASICSR